MDDAALLAAIREHAYLEGDFLLRSGKRSSYYLDKFRFETDMRPVVGLASFASVKIFVTGSPVRIAVAGWSAVVGPSRSAAPSSRQYIRLSS